MAIVALSPRHPDGSIKIVAIHSIVELSNGETKALTLVLDRPPTVGRPTPATIDIAWMREPRLIGCTDATHLCASRVAAFPLVPVTHPNLPETWKTFLTTEFDTPHLTQPTWGNMRRYVLNDAASTPYGDTATYDAAACVYYRYLTSGDLDKLSDAHHLAAYDGGMNAQGTDCNSGYSQGVLHYLYANGSVRYLSAFEGHRGAETWPTEIDYTAPLPLPGVAGSYGQTEWNSGFHHDMWLCWCLSGWPQALAALVPNAMAWMVGTPIFGGAEHHQNLLQDSSGMRMSGRLIRQPAFYLAQANLPMGLTNGTVRVPSIRTNRQMWLDYFQQITWDMLEKWAFGGCGFPWAPDFPPTDFHHGIWGFSPGFSWQANIVGASPAGQFRGGYPNFDAGLTIAALVNLYLNVLPDARFQKRMSAFCYQMLVQTRPKRINGKTLYGMPYMVMDGAGAAPHWKDSLGRVMNPYAVGGFFTPWSTTYNLAVWTYGYALTGDPAFLTVADAHATVNSNVGHDGGAAGMSWKQFGEVYHMAFPAAAWRAGVPWNGWDVRPRGGHQS